MFQRTKLLFLFVAYTIPGIGFSYLRIGGSFIPAYVANNSALFLSQLDDPGQFDTLANLECSSGTTSSSPEQLLFITPAQYQDQVNNSLVYEPGLWKLESTMGIYFSNQSFTGGVFTCRMPDENGIVVDTSIGIFPKTYDKNSKWIACCL